MTKIYIGCGKDRREGYFHVDKRRLEGVDLVCNAWEIYPSFKNVEEIYSRHMLEHLTSMEADFTLRNWYKSLKVGGFVNVIVPNLDYHCEQWLRAEWSEDSLHDKWSDARHGFAGFYGWQNQCDPNKDNYETSYWDVHKSGYNTKRLKFILERIGFDKVDISVVDKVHLVAKAFKSMDPSERQISPSLRGIRKDHKERYHLAAKLIKPASRVLDAACGVGYGSFILHTESKAEVIGVDISVEAIQYAKKNYIADGIHFQQKDLKSLSFPSEYFDTIVSFETYEHIDFNKEFLKSCYDILKEHGQLIVSTPNQKYLPYDRERFKFHIKHYHYDELLLEMEEAGFFVESTYSQDNYGVDASDKGVIRNGCDGQFLIMIARKL